MAERIAVVCGDITAALNRRPELMKAFAACSDRRPLFVCPQSEPAHFDAMKEMGFDCEVVESDKQSLNPLANMAYFQQIASCLEKHRPDEVFAFHMLPILASARACKRLGIRCHCLFAGLGYVFSDEKKLKRRMTEFITVRLLKSNLNAVDTIFVQNPDDRKTLADRNVFGPATNVVVVNGSGVSLERFPYSPPDTEGPVVFLLISRILRDKGIPEYHEAARRLREKWGDQVRVQILGPFDKNPTAMSPAQMSQWHDEGIIEYLGVTEDVRPYLKRMSVFTLPSFYMEGTPKTILESMATGRPIITTTSRGCKETVVEGQNGFLIEPRNIDSLFEAMDYFVTNREMVEVMGKKSREIAQDRYDVQKVNRRMLDEMGIA